MEYHRTNISKGNRTQYAAVVEVTTKTYGLCRSNIMTSSLYLRRVLRPALAALLLSAATAMVVAQPASMRRAGQAGRPAMSAPRPGSGAKQGVGSKQNQEHLAQWMDRHSNL